MELKRLVENKDEQKKKKSIGLKSIDAIETKAEAEDFQSESDEETNLMF